MHRFFAVLALMLATSGCTSPHPYIRQGDAKSVDVGYYGDAASALPLATQHCARYERVAKLVDAGSDAGGIESAIFECLPR
jgi:hypothetical protein